MTIIEIKQIIKQIGSACIANHIKFKHSELYSDILKYSDNIDHERKYKFSESLYLYVNELTEIPRCKICNLSTRYLDYTRGYQETCSRNCSHQDKERIKNMQNTCLDRYGNISATGTDEYNEKVKNTCLERYGSEHHLSKNSSLRDRIKATNIKKYGGISPFSNRDVQETWRKNFFKKHGCTSPLLDPNIKAKAIQTRMVKLYHHITSSFKKCEPMFSLEEYLDNGFGYENKYSWNCLECNKKFESYYANGTEPTCPTCYPKYRSKAEIEIVKYLSTFGYKIETNVRSILRHMEIDIVVPELKICIEYNGNYYHSELAGKSKKYHLTKTDELEKLGYTLIHIFEDEWIYKNRIIKSKLKSKFKKQKRRIYARKCIVREIDTKTKNLFLKKYHIQGGDKSNTKLGLYYNNHLVAVMTFCKARKILRHNTNDTWELSRFASLYNFNILGAGGKLLKHFIKMNKCSKILSYADRRFTNINNNVYEKLEFKLDHISSPNYYYMKTTNYLERLSRLRFQKHKLNDLLPNFDKEKTEWVNMKENGFNRIWDCGNLVYVLSLG